MSSRLYLVKIAVHWMWWLFFWFIYIWCDMSLLSCDDQITCSVMNAPSILTRSSCNSNSSCSFLFLWSAIQIFLLYCNYCFSTHISVHRVHLIYWTFAEVMCDLYIRSFWSKGLALYQIQISHQGWKRIHMISAAFVVATELPTVMIFHVFARKVIL